MKRLILFFSLLAGILYLGSCNSVDNCTQCNGIFSKKIDMIVDNDWFQCSDGAGECLHVQFRDAVIDNDTAWEEFTDDICGFHFTPGYRYRLEVRRKKDGEDESGAPHYLYCLIDVVDSIMLPLK